ncbi:hypothetical protein RV15_GL000152 [Enterococcus silesiacus]|uniref:Uncharacterized protein n=1 Tax=Enterococcus silesiacus TaxID=332949 RepID=A0AA91GK47_9ENTE|nr:hypothetical protein RV15_GL000152 [Enterococcus silesiacus]
MNLSTLMKKILMIIPVYLICYLINDYNELMIVEYRLNLPVLR